MKTIEFPYGKEKLSYTFGDELVGVLTSSIEEYVPEKGETELVENAVANHCSEFIAHNNARTGILENNPIHTDMLWAAKKAKLAFIVNVVLNADKEVIFATAGDVEEAHKKGTDFLSLQCGAKAVSADIVISTNGGYLLDQNMYQAVKGMTAAEATVKKAM